MGPDITPEYLSEKLYIGLLFGLSVPLCLGVAAALWLSDDRRAWLAGAALSLGMIVAFLISRTFGLPGFNEAGVWEHWTEGFPALAAEIGFLAAAGAALLPAARTPAGWSSTGLGVGQPGALAVAKHVHQPRSGPPEQQQCGQPQRRHRPTADHVGGPVNGEVHPGHADQHGHPGADGGGGHTPYGAPSEHDYGDGEGAPARYRLCGVPGGERRARRGGEPEPRGRSGAVDHPLGGQRRHRRPGWCDRHEERQAVLSGHQQPNGCQDRDRGDDGGVPKVSDRVRMTVVSHSVRWRTTQSVRRGSIAAVSSPPSTSSVSLAITMAHPATAANPAIVNAASRRSRPRRDRTSEKRLESMSQN